MFSLESLTFKQLQDLLITLKTFFSAPSNNAKCQFNTTMLIFHLCKRSLNYGSNYSRKHFFLNRRWSLIVMCVGANSPGLCFVFSVHIDQIHYWFHYQDTNDIISSSFKDRNNDIASKGINISVHNAWFSNHYLSVL